MARRWLILLFCAAWPGLAGAERYLSIAEAQKQCLPEGDRFEEKTFRYSAEQARAIEKQSGVKARGTSARVWIGYQRDKLVGVMFVDQVIGKHELIDYAVGIAPDGKVRQVEILEYRESHGGEIRGAKWRAQFRGKSAGSALRLNGDIYNISGATMSCRHVTEGVRRVLATFEHVVRPALPAGGGGVPNSPAVSK